jgi:NADPH2:quinone reductase
MATTALSDVGEPGENFSSLDFAAKKKRTMSDVWAPYRPRSRMRPAEESQATGHWASGVNVMAMRAAVVGQGKVTVQQVEPPRPAPTELLVRVRAAGLNRADLAVAAGARHGSFGGPGTIPGLEWAGEVVEVGKDVRNFTKGDRVMCSGLGAYADYAVVDWRRALPVPTGLDFVTAATLPVALQTMHDAIVTNGRLQRGETILIQGASSGVGLMALQIARKIGASVIIGTSTNAERRARLPEFGATCVIDPSQPDWPEAVRRATADKGVNLIIDQVSGPLMNGHLAAAAIKARIVNVGRLGGMHGEFDFDLHALKRIAYIGVTFRTRTIDEIAEINSRMRADLWDAVVDGQLRLPLAAQFPLERVEEALAYMRENRHFGKIVLRMDEAHAH